MGTGLGTRQVKKTNTRHGGGACTGDMGEGATASCSLSSASNLRRIRVSLFFFSIHGFNRHSRICCTDCLTHISIPLPFDTL